MDDKKDDKIETQEDRKKRGPSDDRFADPVADQDPRTSKEGVTSVGATDLNADTALTDTSSPDAVPGVRRG